MAIGREKCRETKGTLARLFAVIICLSKPNFFSSFTTFDAKNKFAISASGDKRNVHLFSPNASHPKYFTLELEDNRNAFLQVEKLEG